MSDKLKEILPFNLSPKMTIKDVVQLVGEPDKKGGSRMVPIWISYEDMGLQLDFVGSNWEDPNNPLSFVTIFQPLNEKFRVI
ncbi:hypothetical protein ROZALSC1DRAFT_31441 [Rozella allomycis CSF55]|uniref:Uncharacterized protein n=1 Tax=Rozella allomycis (strain CSF55) TaxID=988480 RepID=A0A075AN61_ROZAC|nr:hypothetical protein O9G_006321 [Rozella allomycis CSF55]RKP16672.1 hypothetical protein ROZALSC1DRAFT_31441 [Rozella allomycis CSF55]|eukprot:EPZ31240.1 hypothetical protein O9G_006321 [Rozella allomycis CSF55]